ncbi:carbon starvation CstA family protein [Nesterenkonia alba]|uniref:carbon starvation CstA family protein n=1 Tax=Nesterenkonia alba TaxID=515814 RepID=UPI0003B51C4A|nr:carbon starvation protein A [Nesterenkonia alba]
MASPNAVVLAVIGVSMLLAGYFLYSKFLARRVYQLNDEFVTAAHRYQDGIDYVPTNRFVLWGHHFTSVAGVAPIAGPAIAIIWGWLPAFLWVTLGAVFIGAMHDFGALWASNRNKGQSVGTLSGRYIGRRGRTMFLAVIFLMLVMTITIFAVLMSGLLVDQPTAVIPSWGALIVALGVGVAIYRLRMNLVLVTAVGVAILYALILVGNRVPVELPETFLGLPQQGQWIVLIFIYAAIASVLPVWVLLQPRDYINGVQLFIALGVIYGSVLLARPEVVAPALNDSVPEGTPSMIPLLFVTIACGAISGFHGIVASGTTSKQLDKETDSRFVGYFGTVGEGLLALGSIIAVSAGFQTVAEWRELYSEWNAGGAPAFIEGGANIVSDGIGLDNGLSATLLATIVVLFAATSMDTALRLKRFVVQEIAQVMGFRLNMWAATGVVLVIGLTLAFSTGADGTGGMTLWPLFGTTNQILASVTMSILVVILIRKGRMIWPVIIPMAFVLVMSTLALVQQLGDFWSQQNWLLLSLNIIVLVTALWAFIEAVAAMNRARFLPKETEEQDLAEQLAGSEPQQTR